jgi:hypothetical protein
MKANNTPIVSVAKIGGDNVEKFIVLNFKLITLFISEHLHQNSTI